LPHAGGEAGHDPDGGETGAGDEQGVGLAADDRAHLDTDRRVDVDEQSAHGRRQAAAHRVARRRRQW
jgi:hypothetical protein